MTDVVIDIPLSFLPTEPSVNPDTGPRIGPFMFVMMTRDATDLSDSGSNKECRQ
jgi:hypothetical protein